MNKASSRGFPLGAIFLLMALFCVLLATNGLMGKTDDPRFVIYSIGIGAVSGCFTGIVIGLYHFNRFRGAAIGMLSGSIFGGLVGPFCARAMEKPWRASVIAIGFGVLLVLIAIVYRRINGDDPVSGRYDFSKFLDGED